MPFRLILIMLVFTYANGWAKDVDFIVISSANTDVVEIDKEDLQKVFLGKTVHINGLKILPVLIKEDELQKVFFEKVLDRSKLQYTRTWQKLVFTGKGKRPEILNSVDELVTYLKTHPNCISFILKSDLTNEVREIKVK